MTFKRKFGLFFFILSLIKPFSTFIISEASNLNNSLGIAGSFANHVFTMVPNETIDHPDVFVRFFNNYTVDITITLNYEAPNGVSIDLKEGTYSLASGSNLLFPVKITTTAEAVPGQYPIAFGATLVQQVVEGIVVTGSARLLGRLNLLGEAGQVNIFTLTPRGNPIPAVLNVYRKNGPERPLIPIRQSLDGTFAARLAAGEYYVTAHYLTYLVAEQSFSVIHLETIELTLIANLVQVTSFDVTPEFFDDDNQQSVLGSIRATYAIQTIFEPLEQVKIYMHVSLNQAFLEKVIIANILQLGIGSFVFYQNFVPSKGWKEGTYSFFLQAYQVIEGQEQLFGESSTDQATILARDLPKPEVITEDVIPWWLVALLLIITVLFVEIALWVQKRHYRIHFLGGSRQSTPCQQSYQEVLKALADLKAATQSKDQPHIIRMQQKHRAAVETYMACLRTAEVPLIDTLVLPDVTLKDLPSRPLFSHGDVISPGVFLEITPTFETMGRIVAIKETGPLPETLLPDHRFLTLTNEEIHFFDLTLLDTIQLVKRTPGTYVSREGYFVEIDLNHRFVNHIIFSKTRLAPTTQKGHRWVKLNLRKINY